MEKIVALGLLIFGIVFLTFIKVNSEEGLKPYIFSNIAPAITMSQLEMKKDLFEKMQEVLNKEPF